MKILNLKNLKNLDTDIRAWLRYQYSNVVSGRSKNLGTKTALDYYTSAIKLYFLNWK